MRGYAQPEGPSTLDGRLRSPRTFLERHRRIDRALVAAAAEMCATGISTRKVQRIAEKMGIGRLGRGRVSTTAVSHDAEIADLAEGRSRCARYP